MEKKITQKLTQKVDIFMPSTFRWEFLPYCIKKLPSGNYVVLNRRYKPLGFFGDHADYEKFSFKAKNFKLRKFDMRGGSGDTAYLYSGSMRQSKEMWDNYTKRLQMLESCNIQAPYHA